MLTRVVVVLLTCVWSSDSWTDPSMSSYGLCLYGNSVECCWGWRPAERGRCQPRCQQGCKHGECVAPDRCKCHPGYTGKACNHDLNECGMKPRPCKHRCMNTPGSYKCYCQDGYTMQPDGSCRNARTCFHANCQYGCEVVKGAVRCTCPSPGLRLGPDRRTCVDIDECVLGGSVCPHRRKCVNTFGSFMCKCHRGFRLMYINGRYNCIDKDTRPFCSLNPSSPKCRCRDGSCAAVLRVTVEPQTPRTRTATPNTPDYTVGSTGAGMTTNTATQITTGAKSSSVTATTVTTVPTTTVTTVTMVTAVQFSISATLSTTAATTTTGSVTTSESRLEASATTTPTTAPAATVTTTTTTTTSPTTAPSPSAFPTPAPPVPPFTDKTLTVALSSASPTATTVNNRLNMEVTHRQRGDVHIPRRPGDNHVWDFDVELGETADGAADDPGGAVLQCTFNQGLCGWMSDGDGDLHWEISVSPAGRRYLSMPRLKSGQRSVRGARLSVPIVPPWNHGDLCFSFSHWLTGYQVGTLQLFVQKRGRDGRNSPALWSRTGGHGWRHTQVTLMAYSVDRVLLKAYRRMGQRGQISIDDVTLRQGACL